MTDLRKRTSPTALHAFAVRVLRAVGMPSDDAATTATGMVWADLRGLEAHGVAGKLGDCVRRIQAGGTRAAPTLPTIEERRGTAMIDGQNAWGHVAADYGMRTAIAKAKQTGIGAVSVRDVSSAAALGYYPSLAAAERLIGFIVTNGPARMPAWGGRTKLLGNQAHAISCPAGRHFPLLFDSATTTISKGQMESRRARGELLPEGVLLNEHGEPTRDPADWFKGQLLPIGGHRGFALSFAFELLTGVLAAGSRMAPDVKQPFEYGEPQGVALFCLVIDPELSLPYEVFTDRIDRLIDQVHASRTAPGADRILVPGERGYLVAEERERDGIPLTLEQTDALRGLAGELDLEADSRQLLGRR